MHGFYERFLQQRYTILDKYLPLMFIIEYTDTLLIQCCVHMHISLTEGIGLTLNGKLLSAAGIL